MLKVCIFYNRVEVSFLDIPRFGFINIHASLLPKWRGAAPIQRSIMNLDSETGISIMKIVEDEYILCALLIHTTKLLCSHYRF